MDNRSECKYGENCYQRNPDHLAKYRHPTKRFNLNESHNSTKKVKTVDIEGSDEVNGRKENKIIVSNLPVDIKERIKALFLLEMPNDFYEFYEFCKSLSSESPKNSLKLLNLELVGPFDIFDGVIKDCYKDEVLVHYRYYFDPPEFQTVLKGDDKVQLHYGYFRDDPNEFPCFVAKNNATNPTITCVAGNLFGAVNVHVESIKSSADVFRKMKIQKIQSALVKWAKKNKFTLDTITPEIKSRRSKIVAKTFNGIGIVVPYDRKTDVGYRSLIVNDEELKTLLKKVAAANTDDERDVAWSNLQPIITAANIANDESDFGTSLELGLNMFSFGENVLHKTIEKVMCITYKLLQRNEFADILQAHLKYRSKDSKLSTIV